MTKDIKLIEDLKKTNIWPIVAVASVVLILKEGWEKILTPLANSLVADFGFFGVLLVVGLIYWAFSKRK